MKREEDKLFVIEFERRKQERAEWQSRRRAMDSGFGFGTFFNDDLLHQQQVQQQQQWQDQNFPPVGQNQPARTNPTPQQPAQSDPNAMTDAELARYQERLLREEQDRQYQEMLKQTELEAVKKAEEEEAARKIKEAEQAQLKKAVNKLKDLQEKFAAMPEPAAGEGVLNCVLRLPTGSRISRKFQKN